MNLRIAMFAPKSLRLDLHAHALADAERRRLVVDLDEAFQRADVVEHERFDDAVALLGEPVRQRLDAAFPDGALKNIVFDVHFFTDEHHAGPFLPHSGAHPLRPSPHALHRPRPSRPAAATPPAWTARDPPPH